MPILVKDMINYVFDQKVSPKIQDFITLEQLKQRLAQKLDVAYFNEYRKKQFDIEQNDSKFFGIDDKFNQI